MKNRFLVMALILTVYLHTSAQKGYATLSGKIDFLQDSDSVTLITDKYGQSDFIGYQTTYGVPVINHHFQFALPIGYIPLRFHLLFQPKNNNDFKNRNDYLKLNLNGYYLEEGDNIFIQLAKDGVMSFSGKGHEKFTILRQLKNIDMGFNKGVRFAFPADAKLFFERTDSATIYKIEYFTAQKKLLDIFAGFYGKGNFLYMMTDSMRALALETLKGYHCKVAPHLLDCKEFMTHDILQYADLYTNGLIAKYLFDSCYAIHQPLRISNCYNYICNHYEGVIRERMIINLLYKYRGTKEDISPCVRDAFTYINNKDFLHILHKLQSNRIRGAQAYNFELPDPEGQMHSLSEYKGKVVLIDFWFTGCGNCVRVAPYLAKIEEIFAGKPVVFLSINLDNEREQWTGSIQSGKYTSKYTINLFTEGKGFQHPISQFYEVDGGPTLILIDKQGKLMNNPIDPRKDEGKDITGLINEEIDKI
jgi:thiol-disulfide isomerase/thioredoxin